MCSILIMVWMWLDFSACQYIVWAVCSDEGQIDLKAHIKENCSGQRAQKSLLSAALLSKCAVQINPPRLVWSLSLRLIASLWRQKHGCCIWLSRMHELAEWARNTSSSLLNSQTYRTPLRRLKHNGKMLSLSEYRHKSLCLFFSVGCHLIVEKGAGACHFYWILHLNTFNSGTVLLATSLTGCILRLTHYFSNSTSFSFTTTAVEGNMLQHPTMHLSVQFWQQWLSYRASN